MPTVEFSILGPLEVRVDGEPLRLRGGRQRSVLAFLLLHANEPVSLERLIDALWEGDPPPTAANVVQVYVGRLRRALEPGRKGTAALQLVSRGRGYMLRVDPERLDLTRFQALVDSGRAAAAAVRPDVASVRLREALALWRGEPLADVELGPGFAATLRLSELRLAVLEDRIEADLALGRHADVVPELERLVGEEPLRERLLGQLMLAFYRSGRQADALRVYVESRGRLVEELGIEPGPELQRLQHAILEHDPALGVAAAPPASAEVEAEDVRKPLTVVFASLAAVAGDGLDPDAEALGEVAVAAARVLERHGAAVERPVGDVVVGLFGVPAVQEDDALRAVRAAAELATELAARAGPLRVQVRVGVESGEALVGAGTAVAGVVAATARHLEQRAAAGVVLLGAGARALVRDAVRLENVGDGAWRLVDVATAAAPPDGPLVGRSDELRRLEEEFARAVRGRTCHLYSLLGPPGIGKSRLAQEFARLVATEAAVASARCPPHGEGTTFTPLGELVAQLCGAADADAIRTALGDDSAADAIAGRVAGAIAGDPIPAEDVAWAVRRLVEALARRRPLVLVLEDLHAAAAPLLDLVEHLAGLVRGEPLFLLCLARPDLLDVRPGWGGGSPNATSTLLEPLGERESAEIVAQRGVLPDDVRRRIVDTAEGNPLFLEQLVATAMESGPDVTPALPPTVQAVLAARLDRLPAVERRVLGRAAVVGKEFRVDDLAVLAPNVDVAALRSALDSLVRKDLVRAVASTAYSFRHQLVRDAAYASLAKRSRAELHERLAERLAVEEAEDELVGYHLEQAQHAAAESGSPGAERLGPLASARLASAGRRAYARGDAPAAAGLLARAVALRTRDDPARRVLLPALAEALRYASDLAAAARTIDEALAEARAAADERVEWEARVVRVVLRLRTDTAAGSGEIADETMQAIAAFERLGHRPGLAQAWHALGEVRWQEARAGATAAAMQRAIAHARAVGDVRTEARSRNFLLGAALFGPMPVPEATALAEEVLAAPRADHRAVTAAHRALAGLRAMAGDFPAARAHAEAARAISTELGLATQRASSAEVIAIVELLAGDPAAAKAELRTGMQLMSELGDRSGGATLAALLAQALFELGDHDGALAQSAAAEFAPADDRVSQVRRWLPAARVLVRRHAHDEAERLARAALAVSEQTDFLTLQAEALDALGDVLLQRGATAEARAALERAVALSNLKGDVVGAARASRRLERAAEISMTNHPH